MSAQAIRLTEVDIENALSGHLDVVFQPVFSLRDGALMRVETFVRWEHPGLGVLPPGAFISFFEAQGRMGELTRYVLREATKAYKAWRGTEGPGLSVNLAQSDVADASFAADLAAILEDAGLPARLVTLECPPFAPDTDPADAALMLGRLSRTGCPLAAEVRGRASDLLKSLTPFPFAEVKTGGSAILRFGRTAKGGPGLTAISELLDLAGQHGARAVAVGVEDEAAARALAGLGFDGGQGKLFSGTGDLSEVAPEAANTVRAALGLAPLEGDDLEALSVRPAPEAPAPAKLAPLILGDDAEAAPAQAPSEPDDAPLDPDAPDATTMAIMRLKAKKIAAKKAALKRAQADREQAEQEVEAARQASDTARRLQERLASELDAALPGEPEPAAQRAASVDEAPEAAPTDIAEEALEAVQDRETTEGGSEPDALSAETTAAPRLTPHPTPLPIGPSPQTEPRQLSTQRGRPAAHRREDARASALPVEDDAEAGVLLSQNLAEIALGVSKQSSFAEGLRLDGYAPSGGGAQAALLGAVAPASEPEVRRGEAEPAAFVDVASAIHQILADLPVPEEAKPRLLESAEMPLANRGAPPAVEPASNETFLPADEIAPEPVEALTADLSAEDTLDAVVATSPVLDDDTPDVLPMAGEAGEANEAAPAANGHGPRRARTNFLTRKYRITHFWPRSWKRAVRRYRAKRALRAEERIGDAEALAA